MPSPLVNSLGDHTDSYNAAGNVQHGNVQVHKQELGLNSTYGLGGTGGCCGVASPEGLFNPSSYAARSGSLGSTTSTGA